MMKKIRALKTKVTISYLKTCIAAVLLMGCVASARCSAATNPCDFMNTFVSNSSAFSTFVGEWIEPEAIFRLDEALCNKVSRPNWIKRMQSTPFTTLTISANRSLDEVTRLVNKGLTVKNLVIQNNPRLMTLLKANSALRKFPHVKKVRLEGIIDSDMLRVIDEIFPGLTTLTLQTIGTLDEPPLWSGQFEHLREFEVEAGVPDALAYFIEVASRRLDLSIPLIIVDSCSCFFSDHRSTERLLKKGNLLFILYPQLFVKAYQADKNAFSFPQVTDLCLGYDLDDEMLSIIDKIFPNVENLTLEDMKGFAGTSFLSAKFKNLKKFKVEQRLVDYKLTSTDYKLTYMECNLAYDVAQQYAKADLHIPLRMKAKFSLADFRRLMEVLPSTESLMVENASDFVGVLKEIGESESPFSQLKKLKVGQNPRAMRGSQGGILADIRGLMLHNRGLLDPIDDTIPIDDMALIMASVPGLEVLDLSDAGTFTQGAFLKTRLPQLRELLMWSAITDELLCRISQNYPKLQKLQLYDRQGVFSSQSLAQLENLVDLVELDIGNCNISSSAFSTITNSCANLKLFSCNLKAFKRSISGEWPEFSSL